MGPRAAVGSSRTSAAVATTAAAVAPGAARARAEDAAGLVHPRRHATKARGLRAADAASGARGAAREHGRARARLIRGRARARRRAGGARPAVARDGEPDEERVVRIEVRVMPLAAAVIVAAGGIVLGHLGVRI